MNWYLDVLKKYAVFDGRARRMEYWMFVLFNIIISFAIGFIVGLLKLPPLLAQVYSLAVLVPSIAVGVRRLHDTNRSGWMLLLCLIPCVGLVVLYWMILEGTPGENQYGPNPKELGLAS